MATVTQKAVIPFLVGMMLLTGVCNTLLTKYQDMQCVRNCNSSDPKQRRNFEQPVWQTVQMFIGEMGCFLVMGISALYTRFVAKQDHAGYQPLEQPAPEAPTDADEEDHPAQHPDIAAEDPVIKSLQPEHPELRPLTGWRILLLALPAICDITGTTLMNVGLLFVAASIYQMTRGALVLFVGLFSVLFLRRRLGATKWTALCIVVAGVAIVGLAGVVERTPARVPGDDHNSHKLRRAITTTLGFIENAIAERGAAEADPEVSPVAQTILGVFLIALAQIFTASQFVIEEAIMHRYSMTPLGTVSWEGTFGLFFTLLFMLIVHLAYGRTPKGRGGYFDATTGWREMTHNRAIAVTSVLIMISIGGFNFFGLSVTRTVSATARSTIDTSRTLFIWIVSLGLGWETFKWLQVVGFAGLVYGTFLFNDIVKPPNWSFWRRQRGEPTLPIDH